MLAAQSKGGAGVTIGAYLSVMQVLGLENDLNKLAAEDEMGRQLQDSRLIKNVNAFPFNVTPPRNKPMTDAGNAESDKQVTAKASLPPNNTVRKTTGTTSADLASLLKPLKKPIKGN
ncbi:hypothetical protein QZQ97_22800 [Serratia sp. root2]|nr:hypothetical protein [Serratia sp. root2]MDT3253745.1 hypothetical protein [Serratia sp. root2]